MCTPTLAPGRNSVLPTASTLLAASVAIAEMTEVAIHETGHLVVDRLIGADASLALHPFGPSLTEIHGVVPDSGLGWAVAAGPGGAVALCVVIAVLAWRHRNPALLPLVLLGPAALLLEGANAILQLAEGAAGTDMTILVARGVPAPVLAVLASVALVSGIVWASAAVSLAGVEPAGTGRWAAPIVGFTAYPLVGLGWVVAVGPGDPTRNLGLVAFGLLVGTVVGALHPPVIRRLRIERRSPNARTAYAIGVLAVCVAAVLLLLG